MEGDIAKIGTGGATGYVKLTQINKVFQKPEEASFVHINSWSTETEEIKRVYCN